MRFLIQHIRKPNIRKKVSLIEWQHFFQLILELLNSGFSLKESLEAIPLFYQQSKSRLWVEKIAENLNEGRKFSEVLVDLKAPSILINHLAMADNYGNFTVALQIALEYLLDISKQKNMLYKAALYPLLLIFFFIMLVSGILLFLVPKLEGLNHGKKTLFLQLFASLPKIGLISISIILISILASFLFLKRKSAIYKANFLVRLPIIDFFMKCYYTAYISMEWGLFLIYGLEFIDILRLMQKMEQIALFNELAFTLERSLEQGVSVAQQLEEYNFFYPEFSLLVKRAEVNATIGEELKIYSRTCWQKLLDKSEKWIQLLQPVVLILIGLSIIGLYLGLLLPLYNNMGGLL